METKYLGFLFLYYGLLIVLFNALPVGFGVSTTHQISEFNTTFTQGEIEQNSGFLGFFNSIYQIFKVIIRFMIFAFIGIGLPSVPAWFQTLFSAWSVFMSFVTIAFIKNAFWKG